MVVSLQFGLRSALASDFAPSSPIWLLERLFYINISSLIVRNARSKITHYITLNLQLELCSAVASDFAPSSPIWF